MALASLESGPAARALARAPAAAPSFEAIYDEHFDFVWRNARRLGVSEASLDDVVQEVFLVLHRRLGGFEGRSSMKTFLFGILARVASDHRRSLRRKSPHARGEAIDPDSVADEASSPHERALRSEGVALLHRLLDELDDDKRAIFVCIELEQMTVPEAAESLGLNLNTAYGRLRAARATFNESVVRVKAELEAGNLEGAS